MLAVEQAESHDPFVVSADHILGYAAFHLGHHQNRFGGVLRPGLHAKPAVETEHRQQGASHQRHFGALLRGIEREGIERGQVLAKPGSITPHTNFKGEIYVLTKEEGGRHTPFFTNYRPQFYFRTTDVTGICTLPEGTEMVMPGDNVRINVDLGETPIAMEAGVRFAIREGGRTVGAGVVTKILDVPAK